MTQTEFLLDLLEYYTTDVNRRCVTPGRCWFSPVSANKEGISEGCAIGRHMTSLNQLLGDKWKYGVSDIYLECPNLLPEWMIELGAPFLRNCQNLHDMKSMWTNEGLSEEGRNKVKYFINRFGMDSNVFTKFLT